MVQDRAIYNGGPIGSFMWSIERRHFQWPWTTPAFSFKVAPFFDAEYLKRLDIQTWFQWNTNSDTPYWTVSFRMTLSELEWLRKIFNDTNHRTVSLRQLSFLFSITVLPDFFICYVIASHHIFIWLPLGLVSFTFVVVQWLIQSILYSYYVPKIQFLEKFWNSFTL